MIKTIIPINTVLMPLYYKDFHCLAADCRDDCCGEWRIQFDKADYQKLQALAAPPELRQKLDKLIRILPKAENMPGYAEFDIAANGYHCPLRNSEGLCSLQLSCGFDALPKVCRVFPRRHRYTAAAKELSLSLGCEGVLQLLWDLPQGVDFVEEALPVDEQRTGKIKAGENLVEHFPAIRSLCIDVLQNRALPLTERLILLGVALQKLLAMDWQRPNVEGWLWQVQGWLADSAALQLTAEIPGNLEIFALQNLHVLDSLQNGNAAWVQQVVQALQVQRSITISEISEETMHKEIDYEFPLARYQQLAADFTAAYAGREYFFENLMVSAAMLLTFPSLDDKDTLWHSYVQLGNLYSFLMFVAVLGCAEDKSKEQLFHMLVMASRSTIHNDKSMAVFRDELFQHESSSLAHMAILLRYI